MFYKNFFGPPPPDVFLGRTCSRSFSTSKMNWSEVLKNILRKKSMCRQKAHTKNLVKPANFFFRHGPKKIFFLCLLCAHTFSKFFFWDVHFYTFQVYWSDFWYVASKQRSGGGIEIVESGFNFFFGFTYKNILGCFWYKNTLGCIPKYRS